MANKIETLAKIQEVGIVAVPMTGAGRRLRLSLRNIPQ